jgi:hypothetical protein
MKFEEWWKEHCADDICVDNSSLFVKRLADQAWDASRKQALEDAAKVCDEVQERYGQYTFTARVSADEIRKME